MKDLEKVSNMLKQFIEESMVEAAKLDEELDKRKLERDAKEKEINDVQMQMDYLDMIRMQLEERLDLLMQERAILDSIVEEKELEVKKNRLDNILDVQTNDGEEELMDEGK